MGMCKRKKRKEKPYIQANICKLCVLLRSPSRWPLLGLYCIPCHHHWQQKALMEPEITLPFLQQEETPHGGRFGEGRRKRLIYKHRPVGGAVDAGLRLLGLQRHASFNAVLNWQFCKVSPCKKRFVEFSDVHIELKRLSVQEQMIF